MFRPGNVIYAVLLIIIALILFIAVLVEYYRSVWFEYSSEKKYIIQEMYRSTGREYRHWKRKLKRLNLSMIPFIGKYLANRHKRKRK